MRYVANRTAFSCNRARCSCALLREEWPLIFKDEFSLLLGLFLWVASTVLRTPKVASTTQRGVRRFGLVVAEVATLPSRLRLTSRQPKLWSPRLTTSSSASSPILERL